MTELSPSSLVRALIPAANRRAGAEALARHWGAETLLVFVLDEELNVYRPAPGFAQTLPGGAAWRDFLTRCGKEGQFTTELPYPNRETVVPAAAFCLDGATVLLLGGSTHIERQHLDEAGMLLLCALLRTEAAAENACARAAAAGEASTRAKALAVALDRARGENQNQAEQLRDALEEASRLNNELNALNETLEARVAERSRQLQEEVAERRKIEEAFVQAQKMEAVGHLTGGIAHDFNNLLTVVIGGLDRIGRQLAELPQEPSVTKIARAKDMALEGARRAAILTHRLLAFSRRQPLEPRSIQLNKLVSGLSELLRRTLGETIELETVLAAGLWRTHVDANQLESAILNLSINARDAMAEGGKLTIETANAHIDEAYAHRAAELIAPGQYVLLAVTDTGCGMDKQTLDAPSSRSSPPRR